MNNCLYVVVPCYQEEEVLPETARRLKEKMSALIRAEKIATDSRILFVNDGSKDRTWELICELHTQDRLFCGISLSRNRGHQNAVLAGLMCAKERCDMAISMDADLQDDINAIDQMVDRYLEGYDIVYGVRSSRATDTAFKRGTAQGYYRLLNALGAEVVYNHADYRLMSHRALEGLSEFTEVNLYLRGIVPQLGYRSTCVMYERAERFAGQSKYPLKKMIALALDGVTSFSTKPIRLVTWLGFLIAIISIICLIWSIVVKITGSSVDGWSSLMASIWFIGGLVILSVGVVGEYVGKIYMETKRRPRYFIETSLFD